MMTIAEMVDISQGKAPKLMVLLKKVEDYYRRCFVFVDMEGNFFVGLSGTRDNLRDWLSNIDPTLEAESLFREVDRFISIYQPRKVTLIGHSQGGAHAVKIGDMIRRSDVEAVTFGGLPVSDKVGFKVTNYLRRDDPMAWIPWWLFGLSYQGEIVMVGPKVWFPSADGHNPKSYRGV